MFEKGVELCYSYLDKSKRRKTPEGRQVARLGALASMAAYETALMDGLPEWGWPSATEDFNGE